MLDEIDLTTQGFGDLCDELPLWSARFGFLLERNLNTWAAQRGELSLTIPIACVEARDGGAP